METGSGRGAPPAVVAAVAGANIAGAVASAPAVGGPGLAAVAPGDGPWRRFWWRFRQHRLALVAGIGLVLLLLTAVIGPLLAPFDPEYIDLLNKSQPPGGAHPLGTDRLGRDSLSRLLHGARLSLMVAVAAVAVSGGLGIALGALAGYGPRWLDGFITRLIDVALALPTFFILVIVQSILMRSALNVVLIIGLTSWMGPAQIVRGNLLSLRRRDFIDAAVVSGARPLRIVLRHLLPGVSSQIVVFLTLGLADAVLIESALSFLGLGIPPYQASWGNMLIDGQVSILAGQWWIALFPGLAILLTSLAINLFGDGLQESLYS